MIRGAGLEHFYQQRTAYNDRPEDAAPSLGQFTVYDDPTISSTFVAEDSAGPWGFGARLAIVRA